MRKAKNRFYQLKEQFSFLGLDKFATLGKVPKCAMNLRGLQGVSTV